MGFSRSLILNFITQMKTLRLKRLCVPSGFTEPVGDRATSDPGLLARKPGPPPLCFTLPVNSLQERGCDLPLTASPSDGRVCAQVHKHL